jgi:hypothetical protein
VEANHIGTTFRNLTTDRLGSINAFMKRKGRKREGSASMTASDRRLLLVLEIEIFEREHR